MNILESRRPSKLGECVKLCLKLAVKNLGPDLSTLGLSFLICGVVVVNYRFL